MFNTQSLQHINFDDKTFFPAYIKYLVKTILNTKRNTNIFEGDLIMPFIDELQDILRQGANDSIIQLSALGRQDNVGFVWGTQNYTGVPAEITSNTHYLFAMKSNLTEEHNKICKDYGANSMIRKDLGNLKTNPEKCKWEGYLFHIKPIVVYDLENGEREVWENEPIKISVFPPMSEHKKPAVKKEL